MATTGVLEVFHPDFHVFLSCLYFLQQRPCTVAPSASIGGTKGGGVRGWGGMGGQPSSGDANRMDLGSEPHPVGSRPLVHATTP